MDSLLREPRQNDKSGAATPPDMIEIIPQWKPFRGVITNPPSTRIKARMVPKQSKTNTRSMRNLISIAVHDLREIVTAKLRFSPLGSNRVCPILVRLCSICNASVRDGLLPGTIEALLTMQVHAAGVISRSAFASPISLLDRSACK